MQQLPPRLTIDGSRTRRVATTLRDMTGFPVCVRTAHGALSGTMTYRDQTLHLDPFEDAFDHPDAHRPVTEPVAVRICDVTEVVVLRDGTGQGPAAA